MKRLSAFLATLALTLPLALAACSGDAATPEAASTPAPTAIATPEAASTPAPTATATPDAASALPPEQACANGVAVSDPEANPGLVADCEALLRAKDALRGDASLDWGGGLAVADWEGVAVSGEPPRVTSLDLRGKGLTGSIPRELRRLRLSEVRLSGNALTGCVPSAFEDASGDAASLGLPWCLRYDRLDAVGEVAEAGEWAILGGNGEVLATWEQLRSEAAMLRVHQTDAGGTSWASEFGAVAEGSLIEWRAADDCWVRYRVTGAPVAPASGASGRWDFPVEWMTYAATGAGCKGAVGAGAVLRADEAAPDVIPAIAITSPVRHRTFLVSPPGWTGALDPETVHEPPGPAPEGFGGPGSATHAAWVPYVYTADLAEARRLPYWSDPALPPGWTFADAESGGHYAPFRGYCAYYRNELGDLGADICAYYMVLRPQYHSAITSYGRAHYEPRVIGGRAGIVGYSPLGPTHDRLQSTSVWVFDDDTGVEYEVFGHDRHFLGNNIEPVIEIARSLLPPTDTP